MAIKLHRCSTMWVKVAHPCWNVQKALDAQGVKYEVITHPSNPFRRSKRTELIAKSGQSMLPCIELEDGTVVREESKVLVQKIADGSLIPG
jgi:glutathione S-transferase